MKIKGPIVLIILDGFGFSNETKYNAIFQANTPNLSLWFTKYPSTILNASGEYVGLPKGYIGNSEVGHLTIGSGRRIKQILTIINESIKEGSFFENKILNDNLQKLHCVNGNLHVMGLLSDAGVHSHEKHFYAYIQAAVDNKISNIYLHVFLDGRDVPPRSAEIYLTRLQNYISKFKNVKIASVQGRFYAMDRNKNEDRTKRSYEVLTEVQNIKFKNWQEVIDYYYQQNITDEFIPPTQLDSNAIVKKGDGIIFCNFRADRARQLIELFVDDKSIDLTFFITPVLLIKDANNTISLFKENIIKNSLMDIFAQHKIETFSIAETEKYAHVTYFFRAGRELPLENETQVIVPSVNVKKYVEYPNMSAQEITNTVLESLKNDDIDFYLINYANADMVGHSGDLQATIKAIEWLDLQLGKLFEEVVERRNGTIFITADHGKAEIMFDSVTNQPNTAHTTSQVPFLFLRKDLAGQNIKLNLKELADIAPFILQNLNINVPDEMKK